MTAKKIRRMAYETLITNIETAEVDDTAFEDMTSREEALFYHYYEFYKRLCLDILQKAE